MLLRPILSRIYKHKHLANFCSVVENVKPSLVDPENAVSPASSTQEKAYVISYLVNQCGLSSETAVSASKKVHFVSPDKPNAVLNLVRKLGFTKSQITELVKRKPHLLLSKPEKTLLPKIEYVANLTGISEKDIFRTVSRYPAYLTRSLEIRVGPIYNYLKDTIGAEKANILLMRGSWVFQLDLGNKVIPNVDFLRDLGVPKSCIQLALFHCPEIFATNYSEFKEIVEGVKLLGFDPSKVTFVLAIHARTGKGNAASWDRCYETYSKWGWSKDDIYMAFRKHPNCMLMSEKKISMVLDYLVNKVGRDSRLVAKCPYILFYSMEKRIIPRCSVVGLLSQMGLVKKDWSLATVLWHSETRFLDRYVKKHVEKLPQLYDFYKRKGSAVEA